MSIAPINCPAIRKTTGNIRKAAFCCASITFCAFADPRTIIVMAISDTAGDKSTSTRSQLIPGISMTPVSAKLSAPSTRTISRKDIHDISILNRKEASTFA